MSANLSASILARLLALAKQRGDDCSLLLNCFGLEGNIDSNAQQEQKWLSFKTIAAVITYLRSADAPRYAS